MSVWKVTAERVVYYPNGPQSRTEVAQGELITLSDDQDYLIGTQIGADHVARIDPAAIARAAESLGQPPAPPAAEPRPEVTEAPAKAAKK